MCGGGGAAADLMSTHTFTTGHYTHTLTSGQVTDWTLVTVAEYQQQFMYKLYLYISANLAVNFANFIHNKLSTHFSG